ncbi:MAG: type II and III secretion system protein family protein [Bryobacteraceae bacterium]
MSHIRLLSGALLMIGGALIPAGRPAWGQPAVPAAAPVQHAAGSGTRDLPLTVGKSLVVESPVTIQRVAVGDSKTAEAIAVSPREVLVNGKAVGDTSLIVWQQGGNRLLFDLRVRASNTKLEAVRHEIERELPGQDVTINVEDTSVYVRGTVADMLSAERAIALATTLGKPVNLLRVKVPASEQQILLKVRFADVDRTVSQNLGMSFFSSGGGNTQGSIGTGNPAPPTITPTSGQKLGSITLGEAATLMLFRPDLNIGLSLEALESKGLAQILAEPNLLAINGKKASFLSGGEFPFPMVQPGSNGSAPIITLQWREYGIRTNFTPVITPRGTIRLKVNPEVSSLDYSHAISISGFSIPALSTRRIDTEIELQDGQTFAIAGLLDNETTKTLSKIPGISSIPVLGKLFQSRTISKTNSELLVVVTPEVVQPAPAGMQVPIPEMTMPFINGTMSTPPRTPPISVTGQVPVRSLQDSIRVEEMDAMKDQTPSTPAMPVIQFLPVTPAAPLPGTTQPSPTPR